MLLHAHEVWIRRVVASVARLRTALRSTKPATWSARASASGFRGDNTGFFGSCDTIIVGVPVSMKHALQLPRGTASSRSRAPRRLVENQHSGSITSALMIEISLLCPPDISYDSGLRSIYPEPRDQRIYAPRARFRQLHTLTRIARCFVARAHPGKQASR